jgi:tRNA(Arg) A34 adenosine deaminase TadA
MPEEAHMRLAIEQAWAARARGEAAVGAVVVLGNKVIGSGGNMVHELGDRREHAEMVACDKALDKLRRAGREPNLESAVILSTHEPCPHCAGGIVNLRLGAMCFGTTQATIREIRKLLPDFKWRNHDIRAAHIVKDGPSPDTPVVEGFMFDECLEVLGPEAVWAYRTYRAAHPLDD